MTATIRVLICDDHAIVRTGIRMLLETDSGIEVVGEAGDGAEAIHRAETMHPDIILMDLMMPKVDGIEATRQIIAEQPNVHILVLTSFVADDKVFPAIKAGALGYLLKDSKPEELITAIHKVARGEPSLEPEIARKLLLELRHPPSEPLTVDPLTEREVEVLRLIAQGLSNREIANRLVVTERTVCRHVSNILDKLHLASRTQAALYALKEGLASLEDIPDLDEPSD
jgi:NarL family two-component system response regulator LiaR